MIDAALTAFRHSLSRQPDDATRSAADAFAAFAATCDADAHRAAAAFRTWLAQFEGTAAAA